MRQLLVNPAGLVVALVLVLFATGCGSEESASTGVLELPTPRPAPTPVGVEIEVDLPEFTTEAVLIGVTSGERLDVRALPGQDQPIIGQVEAGASTISIVGEAFRTDDGLEWWLVNDGTVQGWLQPQFAFTGAAQDITADIAGSLADEYDSPANLASAVATQVGAPIGATQIVDVSTTEIPGQFSTTVTLDLLGIEDDSLAGYRLVITADGKGRGGNAWWLEAAQQLPLCSRGVSADGLCN